MSQGFSRRAVLPLLTAAVVGLRARSAAACFVGHPFEAGRPFRESYFDEGRAVFRGTAVRYREVRYGAEVSFAVKETYEGDARDLWSAFWQNSTFGYPADLNAFKQDIGEDLVVVLRDAGEKYDPPTSPPMVVREICQEPAMQIFEVMEPVLRARGLIN